MIETPRMYCTAYICGVFCSAYIASKFHVWLFILPPFLERIIDSSRVFNKHSNRCPNSPEKPSGFPAGSSNWGKRQADFCAGHAGGIEGEAGD